MPHKKGRRKNEPDQWGGGGDEGYNEKQGKATLNREKIYRDAILKRGQKGQQKDTRQQTCGTIRLKTRCKQRDI